jgi:hypothetical protein
MLYDPKWEVKTDPYSLAGMIAWLEQQPAEQEYKWANCEDCLVGQYLSAVLGPPADYAEVSRRHGKFMRENPIAFRRGLALANPHTFGAALERARAALIAHD